MKLSRVFKASAKATAAIAAIGASGYGGYVASDYAYQYMANTPMPAISEAGRAAAQTYAVRYTQLMNEQTDLDNTTDEETAGEKLFEDKRSFATDAILDRNLSERDLARLARYFNSASEDDGVRFRSYNYAPETIARRNECLRITPSSAEPHGDDRYAYAQRVETCMINMTDNADATNAIAARMGGMAGGGMTFAFLLGFAARRRVYASKAKGNTTAPKAG